jgi:hypothetical protein
VDVGAHGAVVDHDAFANGLEKVRHTGQWPVTWLRPLSCGFARMLCLVPVAVW